MLSLHDLVPPAVICYIIFVYLLHPIFISPLRKIPSAHPIASISSFWIFWKRYRFQENQVIYNAHKKHGPVVRLAPNELSINCIENGLRTIYAGGYEKHRWYDLFANYDGVPTMFSMAESKPHSQRKRMMANLYAKSTLQNSRGLANISQHIVHERLIPYLLAHLSPGKGRAGNAKVLDGEVDFYQLLNYSTMDLVTAYIFGLQSASNFIQKTDVADWWLGLYQSRKKYVLWPQELPNLTRFLSKFGVNLSPKWVAAANIKLEDWCLSLCDAAESHCSIMTVQDQEKCPENIPVIYVQLRDALKAERESQSFFDPKTASNLAEKAEVTQKIRLIIASELLDQLSAGHETSAITLTFLFDELAMNPKLQTRLRQELLDAFPELHHDASLAPSAQRLLPAAKGVDALPLLHATLMETLRRHAAIPGPQPRITPNQAKNSSAKSGVQLGSFTQLPANVRVSCSPHSLHRNPDVFPEPETFDPDRWLPSPSLTAEEDSKRLAEMHRWFWAFGSGGRMCIGSNLAIYQMKLLVATIVANFAIDKIPSDDGFIAPVIQEDAYTAQPEEKSIILKITRV